MMMIADSDGRGDAEAVRSGGGSRDCSNHGADHIVAYSRNMMLIGCTWAVWLFLLEVLSIHATPSIRLRSSLKVCRNQVPTTP